MAVEERDPHSGYLTTGHEWNGIKELNRPVPWPVWFFLFAAFLFSLVWWVLMPAWPIGETYTHGILEVDQRKTVTEKLIAARARQEEVLSRIATLDFAEIRNDAELMSYAVQTGQTLFGDNCAVCHGTSATGGPGYPDLVDQAWLWGGEDEDIAETIRVGINADHPDSRISQMMAFGRDGLLESTDISDVVSYVRTISGQADEDDRRLGDALRGKDIFADNCASCHGEEGRGETDLGAPDLTDGFWIYGGDRQSVRKTVFNGRTGHMPSWEGRFEPHTIRILTLYLWHLGENRE